MLIPICAVTASDQASPSTWFSHDTGPHTVCFQLLSNLLYFPPGTKCWRTLRLRFAFQNNKINPATLQHKNPSQLSAAYRESLDSTDGT